jgi:xanthine dehydrogenase large subunit
MRWDAGAGPNRGRLLTQAASTYKLPSFSEMPEEFNVTLLENAGEEGAVYGAKAVGEPPLMLAFSVREALRQAAAAFGPSGISVELASPATPEAVYWAIQSARQGGASRNGSARNGLAVEGPTANGPTGGRIRTDSEALSGA